MTKAIFLEEKRNSLSEDHVEILSRESCRRRIALPGFEDWREMLKSSANRRWVRGKETHLVMSLMASRKSGTLYTSP